MNGDFFLHTSLSPPETCICLESHLNLCSTEDSFFPRSFPKSKAGTHIVEMDSLFPKQRMWSFGANMKRDFFGGVSEQETKHNTKNA